MKPPLLLLPGMLCDEAFWRAQIEALTDICDPLVPGYGTADTIEGMAACVLDAAPPSFAVAGHSMGGRVALEIVRRAPNRVERLALLCTDYRGHDSEEARQAEMRQRSRLLVLAQEQGMRGLARSWFGSLIAPDNAGERLAGFIDMGARHSLDRLAAEIHAGVTRPDFSQLLPQIACPALVCAGELDPLRSVDLHRVMAERIPDARLVVIPGAGHMVAMERPEAVNTALRDWLMR